MDKKQFEQQFKQLSSDQNTSLSDAKLSKNVEYTPVQRQSRNSTNGEQKV